MAQTHGKKRLTPAQKAHNKQVRRSVTDGAGKRDIRLSLALSLIGAITQALALIQGGYALGELATGAAIAPSRLATLIGLALAAAAAAGTNIWLTEKSAMRQEARLREATIRQVNQLGPVLSSEKSSGRTVSLATDEAQRMAYYRQTFIGPMLGSLSIPVVVLALMALLIDPVIAAIIFLVLPLVPLTVGGFQRLYAGISNESRRARTKLAVSYLDAIQGLITLRLLGAQKRVEKKLSSDGEKNRLTIMRILAGNQVIIFLMDSLFSIAVVTATAVLSMWRLTGEHITIGGAIAAVALAAMLLEPIDRVGSFFYVAMGGMAAQRAIVDYLGRRPVGAQNSGGVVENNYDDGETALEARELTFAYGQTPVLQDVSLRVKSGEKIAIIGPSGGGKSTLLALVKGDLLPGGGQLRVGGLDTARAGQDATRAQSAFVTQMTWLFTGTIRDNLLLGNPGATDDEIWSALEAANIAAEIRRMPAGLNTQVGERGHSVSGGQAQRLSLARALLANRPLILLDEPTSQVDIESEAQIINAIENIGRERTLVMVTHRYSMCALADTVYLLGEGGLTPVDNPAQTLLEVAGEAR